MKISVVSNDSEVTGTANTVLPIFVTEENAQFWLEVNEK